MAVRLGEAVVYLLGDRTGIEKDLEQTEKKTTGWAKGLAGGVSKFLGGALVAGAATAGAAIVGVGSAAFAAGMSMDGALDAIRISTGATGEELDGLEEDFKAVFAEVPASAETTSEVISELNRRLGLTGEELQDLAAPMLRMTDMLGGDAAQNAALFSRVMGDWGVANEDAAATLDKMFVASQETGAGVDGLMQKVVQFGSPLRLMGFSLDESVALFAKWEKEGVNAELAMSSLRIAAGKFAREGKPLQESLWATIEAIQKSEDESAALAMGMDVFGARAGPDMVAAIREGRFSIEDLTAAMEDADGAIMGAAEATDDFPQKLAVLKNKATEALAPVGLAIMDVAGSLIDTLGPSLTAAAEWLGENLPGAIDALMGWWSGTLQPALETVAGYVAENLVPALMAVASWLGEHVPAAMEALSGFWNETLSPALEAIWGFIQENLTPILVGLAAALLAVVVPAFVAWAGAALSAAAATVAAMAPVLLPIAAIGAAVALLTKAWQDDWLGIRTTLTQFWEETGRPIFEALRKWLQETLTQAIAVLKQFWEEKLLPALQAVWAFIQDYVFPIFAVLWAWLAENIPAAVQTAADFWNNTLKPAFELVWGFLEQYVFPTFATVWAWLQEKIPAAVQTAAKFWNETLKPAFEAVWGFLENSVFGTFSTLWSWLQEKIPEAVQTVNDAFEGMKTKVEAVKGVIDTLKDAASGLYNWLKDHVFNFKVNLPKLPDWAIPGSPTPFELGLRGIAEAMTELGRVELPALGALAAGVTGTTQTTTIQHIYQISNWSPQPESRGDLERLIRALELGHA